MKRIVFQHPDGLHQILGATDGDLPTVLQFHAPDGSPVPFETRGRVVPFASLVRVTHRAAFYREPRHNYTPLNTYRHPRDNSRRCRACHSADARRRAA